jgi:YHS domain-containing protein
MEISVAESAASQQYQAETIYFCSLDCQRKFDKDPGSYMDDMFDEERTA